MDINLLATMDGSIVLGTNDIMLVCALGVGIVFAGLVCIVLLCSILSGIMKLFGEKEETAPAVSAARPSCETAVPATARLFADPPAAPGYL